jgi:hypothetical protein
MGAIHISTSVAQWISPDGNSAASALYFRPWDLSTTMLKNLAMSGDICKDKPFNDESQGSKKG